jgi:hypothetical protein
MFSDSRRLFFGFVIRPREFFVAALSFGIFGLVMFFTSPVAGDFSWSDAPRHALNGIFIRDFVVNMPLYNPKQYAVNYYLQYPALTILFYPPLFSVVLAGSYSFFGFSHAVAQGTVTFFHVLMALGTYLLVRRWLSHGYAIGAALMLVASSEIAFWGRQVMLDIPTYAWLAFTALAFVLYLDNDRPGYLYLTVLLYTGALYTKQTPLFVPGAILLGLLAGRGSAAFRDRHVWFAALIFAAAMVPLVMLQVKFGQVNTGSMMGGMRQDIPRTSLQAWTYYAAQLPHQLGWPTVLLAAAYLVGAVIRPSWRLPRAHMVFLLAWFLLGYTLFSFVMVREPRHDLMILLPLPIFASLTIRHALDHRQSGIGPGLAVGVGVGSLLWSLYANPIPYVGGYVEAARFVMEHAPENSMVLFSGYRDGNFIFNMRAGDRPDLGVVRADKLLLQFAIERERGVRDRGITGVQIEEMIRRYAVRYVVAQTDFWRDLPSMRALDELLHDNTRFRPVSRIALQANFPNPDHELVIYEYMAEIASKPAPLNMEIMGTGPKLDQQ